MGTHQHQPESTRAAPSVRSRIARCCLVTVVASVGAPLSTGCGGGALADRHIVSAELSNWLESSISVVVAGRIAGADLSVVEDDGTTTTFPVTAMGPGIGVLLDMSIAGDEVIDCGDVDLIVPEGGVAGDELLGGYGGDNVAVGIGVGITQHSLENASGVKLRAEQFGIVIGVAVGVEYLVLSGGE